VQQRNGLAHRNRVVAADRHHCRTEEVATACPRHGGTFGTLTWTVGGELDAVRLACHSLISDAFS
jgi:hypothetical protein